MGKREGKDRCERVCARAGLEKDVTVARHEVVEEIT